VRYVYMYYVINLVLFTFICVTPWFTALPLFEIVIGISVLIGFSSAIFQHALLAFAARKGPSSTQAYILGFALSGAIASAVSAALSGKDERLSGTISYALGLIAVILGALSFRYRILPDAASPSSLGQPLLGSSTRNEGEDIESTDASCGAHNDVKIVVTHASKFYISITIVALAFAGSLCVFPGLIAAFKPHTQTMSDDEYTLMLFLGFNLGDAAGRFSSSFALGKCSDFALLIIALIRTCSLLLFAFSYRGGENDYPGGKSLGDAWTMQLVFFQALLGGMLIAAGAMRAPLARPQDPGSAGKAIATTIAVSLAVGAFGGSILIKAID